MKDSIFSNTLKRLDEIQKIAHLSSQEVKLLSTPKRVKRARLAVKGKSLPAWRIVFNDSLGPGKGGIRFHPGVSEDETLSLAFWMTIKNSLAELPYGGAKGGIKFDPKKVSVRTLELVSRKFIDAFYKVLGQDKDIPAPDVYTNPKIMGWMLDEFEKKIGHHEPGAITGKPMDLQGCSLRGDATARGGFIVIKEVVKKLNLSKKDLTIAVQGFGNAGSNLVDMLQKDGFKIVAVSDSKGGTYNKAGLNLDLVAKTKAESGSVINYSRGEKISNQELLELPVGILILAALENQITKDNAKKIRAKHIVEIANGPVTYEADKILFDKNVMVVPDVLANAGGVIASYFEWSQNRTGNILDSSYLAKLFQKKMIGSLGKVLATYKRKKHEGKKIDLRTSAYLIAIKRILAAEKSRGHLK